jgi:hypothetical protein
VGKWSEYLGYGWQLTELRPGTKAPRDNGWQKGLPFNDSALSAGLVHQLSGTAAFDVDQYDKAKAWLAERGVDLDALFADPAAVRIESGRSNRGKLLYALSEPLPSKKITDAKQDVLNFRCIGAQDVLPPSIHPDTGKPYAWGGADLLLGLPPFPAALEAVWRAQLAPASAPPPVPVEADADELAELLAARDPDCDYSEWIKVGMAVHAATKGAGFYIWDNWSRRGEKYKGSSDLMSHWTSFRAAGGVGVGSLLADRVATLEQFPTETTPAAQPGDPAEIAEFAEGMGDETPYGRAKALLAPRLVYLTAQERFWLIPAEPRIPNLDEHLDCAARPEGLDNLFLGLMPQYEVTTKAGTRKERRKPLDFWRNDLASQDRLVVRAPGFHPGEGRLYTDIDDQRYLNLYKPYVVQPVKPTAANMEAWDRLLSRIEDTTFRRWLLQYFAYALRHPGVKITVAPLLCGAPGTGKSTLMSTIPRLLFGVNNVAPMSNEVLNSDFNDLLCNNWFVTFEELKTEGGKRDRITLSNKVKEWITEKYITLHPKGLKPYKVPNRLQFTASTNFDDALHIENDDRRWAICEMMGENMDDQETADLNEGFLKQHDAPGKLRWIFERVDLTGFSPTGKPPRTRARRDMVLASMSGWGNRIFEAILTGSAPFNRDVVSGTDVRDMLIGHGAPSIMRIGSVLKAANLPFDKVHTRAGDLFVWRNRTEWRKLPHSLLYGHIETGARPGGLTWTDEIPLAIRRAAGDDSDPNDVSDLVGT